MLKIANKAFARFYAAFLLSGLGDSFRLLAVNVWLFAATDNSASGRLLVLMAANLPGILLGLFAGVVADRFDKLRTLVVSDCIRFIVSLLLAWSVYHESIAGVVTLVIVGNCLGVFFGTSAVSLLPRLVDRERLAAANGWFESGQWMVQILGPGCAALVLAHGGPVSAFLVDGLSFLTSAFLLWSCRRHLRGAPDLPKSGARAKGKLVESSYWDDLKDGVGTILGSRPIMLLLFSSYGITLIAGCTSFGLIFLISDAHGRPASDLGFALTVNGICALASSLLFARVSDRLPLAKFLWISMLAIVASQIVMGSSSGIDMLVLGIVVSAIANPIYNVCITTLYMKLVPEDRLGRVEGVDVTVDSSVTLFAFVLCAYLAGNHGPRSIFFVSAIACVPSLCAWLWGIHEMERRPLGPDFVDD